MEIALAESPVRRVADFAEARIQVVVYFAAFLDALVVLKWLLHVWKVPFEAIHRRFEILRFRCQLR